MKSGNKYEKYLLRGPIGKTPHTEVLTPIINFASIKRWPGAKLSFRMSTITSDFIMESKPHSHDYDAYMCFIGGNPLNFAEFDAEVELCLGEEQEKQIITESTVVYIPSGLSHCPLTYRHVKKPILFLHIFPESEYERKPAKD